MPPARTELCAVERRDQVWIVRFGAPDGDGALSADVSHATAAAFDEFVADASARIAVVTGAGGDFCSGIQGPWAEADDLANGLCGVTGRQDNPKPVIAAVEGKAHAEGFELALACDLIVAAEGATFAMSHLRSGHAPRYGGPERLAREVPHKRAMGIVLSGLPVSAAEGVVLGFVNELTESGRALEHALVWAARLLERSPEYLTRAKLAVRS